MRDLFGVEISDEPPPNDDDLWFEYGLKREDVVNELKRLQAWLAEHDTQGAGTHPENQ